MTDTLQKIDDACQLTTFMIVTAEEQGVTNIGGFYMLKDILLDVKPMIINGTEIDASLKERWHTMYGQVFRALEGTTLLKLIDEIDSKVF